MKIDFADNTFYNKTINITLTGEQFAYLVGAVGCTNSGDVAHVLGGFKLPRPDLYDCDFWEELRDKLCELADTTYTG